MKLIAIEIDDTTIAEMEAITEEARAFEPKLAEFARRAYRVNRRFDHELTGQLEFDGLRGEVDWVTVAERCDAYRDLTAALDSLYRHLHALKRGGPEDPPPWVAEEEATR